MIQNDIYKLSEALANDIPKLLNYLNIKHLFKSNRYTFCCPIHEGDNPTALTIFNGGNKSKGNWSCWTHHCEEDFGKSLFGFLYGVLNKRHNYDLDKCRDICLDLVGNISLEPSVKSNDWLYELFERDIIRDEPQKVSRGQVRENLEIPSQYFMGRGYTKEILDTFDVGDCTNKGRPMYNRAVAPIYDEDYKYVGCLGRSINNDKPKWKNECKTGSYLYGLNLARKKILSTGVVNIVEGPGDVWRMFEAGYENSVGLFTSSISDDQIILLERSGCLTLNILTDMDEAGEVAAKKIISKCGRRFNYRRLMLSNKDVGESTPEEIKTILENI